MGLSVPCNLSSMVLSQMLFSRLGQNLLDYAQRFEPAIPKIWSEHFTPVLPRVCHMAPADSLVYAIIVNYLVSLE